MTRISRTVQNILQVLRDTLDLASHSPSWRATAASGGSPVKVAIEFAAALAALASAVVSVRACQLAEEANRDNTYTAAVSTRIVTCTALSEFSKDRPSAPPELTDQNKSVAPPAERSDKAANLARALSLCLADSPSTAALRTCVADRNSSPNYKVHDKLEVGTGQGRPKGADILVC